MKILVINAGSSSIKYQVFDLGAVEQSLCSGIVEKIGESTGRLIHTSTMPGHEGEIRKEQPVPNHEAGMALIVEALQDSARGVIHDKTEIVGVGHRVVHAGEAFSDAVQITPAVFSAIQDHVALAPLHNPPNIIGIEAAREFFPDAMQTAVFDTAFHQTIPKHAFLYALPFDFYTKHRVRRYGFHGTSHKFVTHEAARLIQKSVNHVNLITVHLGNGCSMAAVQNGQCVDTTMGLTPLEGLVMGTRCGDLDPAIHEYLERQTGKSLAELTTIMNRQSGLKGMAGTNDMRDVTARCEAGDENAALAIEIYCYRVKKYIGAYSAILPSVDAIVFTAGVGQNASLIREKICAGLNHIGIVLDASKNAVKLSDAREIHAAYSPVKLLVIPTNEELQIARETRDILLKASATETPA